MFAGEACLDSDDPRFVVRAFARYPRGSVTAHRLACEIVDARLACTFDIAVGGRCASESGRVPLHHEPNRQANPTTDCELRSLRVLVYSRFSRVQPRRALTSSFGPPATFPFSLRRASIGALHNPLAH